MVKEFNSTLWIVKKTFFYHITIKLKNMDNWLAKTTQDVAFTVQYSAWAKSKLEKNRKFFHPIAGVTIKRFSVSFSCTVSHENETETETKRQFQRSSLLELPCYLWVRAELLIGLRYMRTKRKNVLLSFL